MSEQQMTGRGDGNFEVVWPLAPISRSDFVASARPGDLSRKRVAFLWDYLFRGDEMFELVEQELRARFSGVDIVGYDTFGNIHGRDEREMNAALPLRLHALGIDAAVVGVGA